MLDDAAKIRTQSPEAIGTTELQICEAVSEWIDAVNNGNPESINALYTPDAVLLATFDPRPRLTAEDRTDYFRVFKSRRKLKAAIDECHIKAIGADGGVASGLYTFRFVDETGAPQTARARFTFVYARQPEGDLLIAAHHSSVIPSPVPAS